MWKLGWGLHLSQSCFNEVRSQPLGAASEHQTLANYPFKVRNVFFFFQQMELHFLITQIYVAIEILLFYLCCIRTIRVIKGGSEKAPNFSKLCSQGHQKYLSLHIFSDHLVIPGSININYILGIIFILIRVQPGQAGGLLLCLPTTET